MQETPDFVGDPKRNRTSNLRIRNPLLYPVELWGQAVKHGVKDRIAHHPRFGKSTAPKQWKTVNFMTVSGY
jgi:hypothetical protein